MWNILKNIIGKPKTENFNQLEFPTRRTSTIKDIANGFNHYFIDSINVVVAQAQDFSVNSNETFENLELMSVVTLGKNLYMNNKRSPNDIDTVLLKLAFCELADVLIYILNCSLEMGVFQIPDYLKISTITPIRKMANTIQSHEFRPINMLPSIGTSCTFTAFAVYK